MFPARFAWPLVFTAIALGAACSSRGEAPSAPTSALPAASDTVTGDVTLKASAPSVVSPANGAVVDGSFATLTTTPATLLFAPTPTPLVHQFELFNEAGVRVQTLSQQAAVWPVSGLQFNQRYTWRVRGSLGANLGPWSVMASFTTPPPSFVVSGRIVSGTDVSAIPGARVQVDGLAAVTADAQGRFSVSLGGAEIQHVTISAPGYVTRETYFRGDADRTCVDVDLIPLSFQRLFNEEAHNGSDLPFGPSAIVRRWSTPPNFTVAATWKDTTETVDPTVIDYTIALIRQYVPVWTSGRLTAGQIEIIPVWRPPGPSNWIQVYWVHDAFRGMAGTGSNPGFMHFNSTTLKEPSTIIHELGHSMGFHHASTSGFLMGPHQLTQTVLHPDEVRISRMLYSRAPGNREPDIDPPDIFVNMPAGPGIRTSCSAF